MKKSWLAVVSIALNVVLLVSVISLGGKLERTTEQLTDRIEDTERALNRAVSDISNQVERAIEEASKLVADYEIQPLCIDSENQTLEADVVLRLREWSEDTTVAVKATAGRNTFITLLPIAGDGICTGQMAFPLSEQCEVKLSATVTRGGVSVCEELGGWGDISMLLPIQRSGWGGEVPTYQDGELCLSNFQVDFTDGKDNYGITVEEPEFRVYINDELAAAEAGRVITDGGLTQYGCVLEPIPCQQGDTVRLAFGCKDEFGLGYEFTLGIWGVPAQNGELEELLLEAEVRPTLTWE